MKISALIGAFESQQVELLEAVSKVLASGTYIGGPAVSKFESEFASYNQMQFCCSVSNGYDALTLALMAAGIGPGDEVIVPAHTFIATWMAVTRCGAIPVPVDVDSISFNMDHRKISRVLSPSSKAILPVHLYGQLAEMAEIHHIAQKEGLMVIEDAAQAHGAELGGHKAGFNSAAACFSFYPTKNLGAFGDAGAVISNNESLIKKIRSIANYGSSAKYVHEVFGFNHRLDTIQAALLSVRLQQLDRENHTRRSHAKRYLKYIQNPVIILPESPAAGQHVWHQFVIRSHVREQLQAWLQAHDIQTLIHYPIAIWKQEVYSEKAYHSGDYPVADALAAEVLSLPMNPWLSHEEIDHVIQTVNEFNPRLETSS